MLKFAPVLVLLVLATPSAASTLSVTLGTGESVQLLGVDAMSGASCEGEAAKAVAALVPARTEKDPEVPNGVYAFTADGALINAAAVETGCAWPTTPTKAKYHRMLYRAFRTAQAMSRGRYKARPATPDEIEALKAATSVAGAAGAGGAAMGEWSGNGSKDTESFTTSSGEWRVVWRATSTSRVGGTLNVLVYNEAGRLVTTISSGDIASTSNDSSVVRGAPGRYYLKIMSANCSWQVAALR